MGSYIAEGRVFSYEFDNPIPGQTYYVKAYARNSSGTSYGDTVRIGQAQPSSGQLECSGEQCGRRFCHLNWHSVIQWR